MSCATEIYTSLFIGCFGHCDKIILPIKAELTGMYTIEWNKKFRNEVSLRCGEFIELDASVFNEDSQNIVKFYNPLGELIKIKKLKLKSLCQEFSEIRFRVTPMYNVKAKPINYDDLLCLKDTCISYCL